MLEPSNRRLGNFLGGIAFFYTEDQGEFWQEPKSAHLVTAPDPSYL